MDSPTNSAISSPTDGPNDGVTDSPGAAPAPALDGRYFDGRSSRLHQVTLAVDGDTAQLRGDVERDCPLLELRVSERIGRTVRKVTFPDGAYVEIRDLATFEQLLLRTGHSDSWVVRLQQSWRGALLAAGVTVLTLGLGYVYLLPVAADKLARAMPPAMERQLGQGVLQILDQRVFSASRFSDQRMDELTRQFGALRPPFGDAPAWHLAFRKSRIGPNAFALPSGDIVLTDELVRLLNDDQAVMGVLAHELGHLHEHHTTRRLIQGAVVTAGAAMLFGDVSSLLSTAPALLLDMKYSRDAERDADDYAVAMLHRNGIDVEHLVVTFERLRQWQREHGGAESSYLSSHPASAERIARIRAAR